MIKRKKTETKQCAAGHNMKLSIAMIQFLSYIRAKLASSYALNAVRL